MPTDILIDLHSLERPLSTAARALGAAGINIEGLSGPTSRGEQLVGHLLVEDPDPAVQALEQAGVRVVQRQDVLVVDVVDRPGALAELYDQADLSSVDFAYLTTRGRIVMGLEPERLQAARKTLGLDPA